MKKITAFMLAFLMACSAVLLHPMVAVAASPTYTGAQFYASNKVDTRTNLSGSNNGYIAAGDDCKIVSTGHMQGGVEYWYINYPVTGGRKNAYAPKSAFVTVAPYEVEALQNITVYRTSSMSASFGTAYKTDQIFVLAASGSNVWIIYPLDSGGYKIGWTKSSNVQKKGSNPAPTPTTPSGGNAGSGSIRVTDLSVNSTDIRLGYGQTFQWNATITPSNASNKKVTYSSSDASVATVSQNGLVTAKNKTGVAVLTVKTDDGGFQKSTIVSVDSYNTISIEVGANPTAGDANTVFRFAAITTSRVSSVKIRANAGYNNGEIALKPYDDSGRYWICDVRFDGYGGVIPITFSAYDASGKTIAAKQLNITITSTQPSQNYVAAWVSTASAALNVRSSPSLSSNVIGQFASKKDIEALPPSQNGFYQVRGIDTTGKQITGYASDAYVTLGKQPEPPPPNATVSAKLDALKKQYPEGSYWTKDGKKPPKQNDTSYSNYFYGSQCNGFAKMISNELFGKYPGSYDKNNVSDIGANGMKVVDEIKYDGSIVSSARAKELFSKAKMGDFIQVRKMRSNGSTNNWPHSMIFLWMDENNIYVVDCNSDGYCIIKWNHAYPFIGKSNNEFYGIKLLSAQ